MAIELPTIVYKDKGPYQRRGGTYSAIPVVTQEEFDALMAEGCVAHPDLIGQAPAAAPAAASAAPVADDNAPPTRAELEAKATELGLKFDGRTSDKKLLAAIEAALAPKE